MIEQLFGSKTRVKLLQLFYANPNRAFYVREITRKIDEQINSVRRELANLLSIGIISSETQNNKLFYEVDKTYEYYKPLLQIFSTEGSVGEEGGVEDELKALGRVDIAIFTGQLTRDKSIDVDFLVVGDINKTQLDKYVHDLEKKEGKEIRYVVMSNKDFEYRGKVNDKFLNNIMSAKKQILLDRDNYFGERG
ncbi:hypothetical protein A3F37_04150 [Candidatus Saccharibacteria bacterium RIFCSPHIGHO2_12_FULL_41_12]|nr:MAG: hypothetical protein A3F37_04150 [Candidatus Saccharibacteria bacterium RIFCSPHIGHO2_12_FULL_41_12]